MPYGSGLLTTRDQWYAQTRVQQAIVSNRAMEEPPWYPNIFQEIENDPKRTFLAIGAYAEMGLLQPKPEGAVPTYDEPFELIPSHFEFATFGIMTSITLEATYEDPMDLMGKLAPMMADSERVTKDVYYMSTINQGYNPVVTMSDGQPLFSQNHLLGPIASGVGPISAIGQTYSNSLGAVQLTAESLRAAELLLALMRSDRGLPQTRLQMYLMVHPSLDKIAKEVTGSPNAPTSSDNRVNTEHQAATVLSNQYLVNENAWYLIAAPQGINPQSGQSLITSHKFQNSVKVWYDPPTRNWNISDMFRSTWGARDWRGLVGSQGAGG